MCDDRYHDISCGSLPTAMMSHLSLSYQNLYENDDVTTASHLYARRRSTGGQPWLEEIGLRPLSPPRIELGSSWSESTTSRSYDDIDANDCDDADARRTLDEIELIHLRLMAEMSDVDEDFDEERYCRQSYITATRSFDGAVVDSNSSTRRQKNFVDSNEDSNVVIRRSRSFTNLSYFYDGSQPDPRRSRSSCYLAIPEMCTPEEEEDEDEEIR